jgi:hypothetical protein
MSKRKADWTCSYCSNILKDPIELPCGETICLEHFEKKVIVLKKELEWKLCQLYEFYGIYDQSKCNFESNVKSHFEQIRSQINQHKVKLIERIDEIASEMERETEIYEKIYLKSINSSFSSFDHCKSRENELNRIEEMFQNTNANLLIQSIKAMQQKIEKSSNVIQFQLNEVNQVYDHLIATNEFKPNLSSFDQDSTSLFGQITFNQYTYTNLFHSEILKDEQQLFELIDLCQFSPNDKWSLLYRGTRDGFDSDDFHSKCDGHCNTLTIIKAKESSNVFGGFTSVSWDGSSGYKSDPSAFIFSLTNKDNTPLKMKIDPNRHDEAIGCVAKFGSSFGGGIDICITNNANTTMGSYSNLGDSYKHPKYTYGSKEAQTFLTGSYKFQINEIEVYESL